MSYQKTSIASLQAAVGYIIALLDGGLLSKVVSFLFALMAFLTLVSVVSERIKDKNEDQND